MPVESVSKVVVFVVISKSVEGGMSIRHRRRHGTLGAKDGVRSAGMVS